jgi:hypothetical protein
MSNPMVAITRATMHEVPLPPPQKPEHEPLRVPDFERSTVAVGAASVWVADIRRSARDFAQRHGGASVALTLELVDGSRLPVADLRAGPGEGFVTLSLAERELGLRLDRIAAIELVPVGGDEHGFRIRGADVGFGGSS